MNIVVLKNNTKSFKNVYKLNVDYNYNIRMLARYMYKSYADKLVAISFARGLPGAFLVSANELDMIIA